MKRLVKEERELIPRLVPPNLQYTKDRKSIGGLAELIYNVPVWGNFPGRKLQKPNP